MEPAAKSDKAEDHGPISIQIDLDRLLFNTQGSNFRDPAWRFKANSGKRILLLPFNVDNIHKASKLSRFPITVRTGRFIGFVIPSPEQANRENNGVDLDRLTRATPGELQQLLFERFSNNQDDTQPQPNNSPSEDAQLPTPESAPRLAREITLHPDGTVQWEMDRSFHASELQSASKQNPYAYKIDPEQLREAQPERSVRLVRKDGEDSRDFAQRKRDQQTSDRDAQNAYRDLRDSLRELPESFREARPSVLYAAIEVPDSDALSLQGPSPLPWTLDDEKQELLLTLSRGGNLLQDEQAEDTAGKLVTMIEGHPLDARAVAIATMRSSLASKVKANDPGYEVLSRLLKSNDVPSRRIALYGVATVSPPTLDSAQLIGVAGEAVLGEERKMLSFASLSKLFSTQATDPENARVLIDRVSRAIADPEGPAAPNIVEQVLVSLEASQGNHRGQLDSETISVMVGAIDLSGVDADEVQGVAKAIILQAPHSTIAAGWLDQKLLGSSDREVISQTLSLLYESQIQTPEPEEAADELLAPVPAPDPDALVLSASIPMTRADHALLGLFDSSDDLQQAAAWAVLGRFHLALPEFEPGPEDIDSSQQTQASQEDLTLQLFDSVLAKADTREKVPASVVAFIANQQDPSLLNVANERFVALLANLDLNPKAQRAAFALYADSPVRYSRAVQALESSDQRSMVESMCLAQDKQAPLMAGLIADGGRTLSWLNETLIETGQMPTDEQWVAMARSRGEASLLQSAGSSDTVVATAAGAALVASAGGDETQEQAFSQSIALMQARTAQLVREQWEEQRNKIFAAAFKRAQGTYQLVATLIEPSTQEAQPSDGPDEQATAKPNPGNRLELGVVELRAEGVELSLVTLDAITLSPTPGQLGIRIEEPASLRSFSEVELSKIAPEHMRQPLDLLPAEGGVWSGKMSLPLGQDLIVSLEPAG